MKYYIITGEASGDMHAANLMKAIKNTDIKADFRVWGGERMQAQGGFLVKHYRDLAFMGFVEVLLNLRTIIKNLTFCKKDILRYQPDVLILVDYPGFNLKMAGFARRKGINIVYYISPQIWAWKRSRIFNIKRNVDKMLVILPFEKEFYARYHFPVEFVGHPLLDAMDTEKPVNRVEFLQKNKLPDKQLVALLPGSRHQEIKKILAVMFKMAPLFTDYSFVIAGVKSVKPSVYQNDMKIPVLFGQMHELLKNSTAAIVTSGTATLETALLGIPEVVCYIASTISYQIAKRLIRVKYISLVNLVMDKPVVKELIQHNLNEETLKTELHKLLFDKKTQNRLKEEYRLLRKKLGDKGASQRAAYKIAILLKQKMR